MRIHEPDALLMIDNSVTLTILILNQLAEGGGVLQCGLRSVQNVSKLIPSVNHSDFHSNLPAPYGGYHSNGNEVWPYIVVVLVILILGLGSYMKWCRSHRSRAKSLSSSLSAERNGSNGMNGHSTKSTQITLDAEASTKWGKNGSQLHKRGTTGLSSPWKV